MPLFRMLRMPLWALLDVATLRLGCRLGAIGMWPWDDWDVPLVGTIGMELWDDWDVAL